jgi:site-specific DNA-methyltransferase (adenine-specific)
MGDFLMSCRIIVGDCRDQMKLLADSSVDSIVCDPPYDLKARDSGGPTGKGADTPQARSRAGANRGGFMGMKWDGTGVAFDPATWAEALRVLKPGGYLLAFGGTRTYHRMVCAIEDAGFDIRDQIGWAFGSGFPKSHNGEWGGTALKPAWEPICVARKPLIGTVEQNWRAHGTGALNIDACRIQTDEVLRTGAGTAWEAMHLHEGRGRASELSADRRYSDAGGTNFAATPGPRGGDPLGRWPANLIHDGSDEVVRLFPANAPSGGHVSHRNVPKSKNTFGNLGTPAEEFVGYADTGSAARFFYCAKTDRSDRNDGCEHMDKRPLNWSSGDANPGSFQAEVTDRSAQNDHPTVKPTDLMAYLVRLVTPRGGIVLDPFMGSGSTGRGAAIEGMQFIGIELSPRYAEIARCRIKAQAGMFFHEDEKLCA